MEQRPPGRTGAGVSVAEAVPDAAPGAGVTLLDTADVHGDGRSEERIREAPAPRSERPFVATEAGRRAAPVAAEQCTAENLRAWIDPSRRDLGVDTLDLVQLHDEVIPGARTVERVRGDVAAADLPPLTGSQLADLERLHDERIRAHVHDRR